MTGIMVSKRDGIATAPDGVKYRVIRGKTLADARHDLVQAYPGDWLPMVVHLTVDDAEPAAPLSRAEQLNRDNEVSSLEQALAESEATVDNYRAQLAAVVDALAAHDLVPTVEQAEPGWVAAAVRHALDRLPADRREPEVAIDEPLPATAEPALVAPPARPRKRAPRADG